MDAVLCLTDMGIADGFSYPRWKETNGPNDENTHDLPSIIKIEAVVLRARRNAEAQLNFLGNY